MNRDPYRELRVGFTAAVSHELRTPLARLLALIEGASLPGSDPAEALQRMRAEVELMDELIDDVLFLSELETGREVVSLGSTEAAPNPDVLNGTAVAANYAETGTNLYTLCRAL